MLRIAVVLQKPLDAEALAALISARDGFQIAATGYCLKDLARIIVPPLDVLVVGAMLDGQLTADRALAFIEKGSVNSALLLDDRAVSERQTRVARHASLAYLTRGASGDELCASIVALAEQATLTTGGQLRADAAHQEPTPALPSLAERLHLLTPREAEVLRLTAMGKSVRQSAAILQLAESTVDNHKARMMKKLDIHNSSELTRLAIRAGIISA